jgi:hypothetical protein
MIDGKTMAEIIQDARKDFFAFLDEQLLEIIDNEIFWSRQAEVIEVGSRFGRSTRGRLYPKHWRVTFTDDIELKEILAMPTGKTHCPFPGVLTTATTWGDVVNNLVMDASCYYWFWRWIDHYFFLIDIPDEQLQLLVDELEMAGVVPPTQWMLSLSGTLGQFRARCAAE